MAKFLALCKYSKEGMQGLLKEKAIQREKFVRDLYESNGAKVESLYWITSGDYTVALTFDCERDFAAALGTAVIAAGGISDLKSFELMPSSEMEKALEIKLAYRPVGS